MSRLTACAGLNCALSQAEMAEARPEVIQKKIDEWERKPTGLQNKGWDQRHLGTTARYYGAEVLDSYSQH